MRLSISFEGFECYITQRKGRYLGTMQTNNGPVSFSARSLSGFVEVFQDTVDEYLLWLQEAAEVVCK